MKTWRLKVWIFVNTPFGYIVNDVYEIAEKDAKIRPTRWLTWMTDSDEIACCSLEVRDYYPQGKAFLDQNSKIVLNGQVYTREEYDRL